MAAESGHGDHQIDGRFNRRAVLVEEAQRRVLAAAGTVASEHVPLAECGGRRLSRELRATCDWPPFARAGLDGYAVRAADTALASPSNPATLRVVDTVAAGGLALAAVEAGTAARVMTGAAVPEGADAVVMLEQTAEAVAGGEKAALIKAAARPGQNVAPRGEEFRLGSPVAAPGELLTPGHAALLGTFGYAAVPVYKRPRVAVFATGSELLPVEAPLAPGQIRDSNSAMVAALIRECGAEPVLCGTLPDELAALREALARVSAAVDMIITTGGVSVGDYDAMAELLRGLASYSSSSPAPAPSMLLFNRVSMRPGSPTSAALLDGKLVLALSGNPGACFVGFELLAAPALRAMQGDPSPAAQAIIARLSSDIGKGSPHVRYVRAKLRFGGDGIVYADPLAFGKSSMMASLAEADGLAVIPSGSQGSKEGDVVQVLLLKRTC
ncbi:molybdopterin molybdenumtransferase MoeA [Paenibacillus nanensis]|uniref:Molybdopterin molybdenumtransferase n=2 Tax=Paenibacillus nanensis TaxID=393251 RepID=A0A3A1UWB7_9BACL|nr:gephyrin-like molybdotransferase Glp [Paenibacillus nanensis]RIX52818.1 molybdopterin molybdenumtransferase MoeA [Paenibacillus nanensis]